MTENNATQPATGQDALATDPVPINFEQNGLAILACLTILAGLIGAIVIWLTMVDTGLHWDGRAMVRQNNWPAAWLAVSSALSGLFWGYLLFKFRRSLLNQAEILQRLRGSESPRTITNYRGVS